MKIIILCLLFSLTSCGNAQDVRLSSPDKDAAIRTKENSLSEISFCEMMESPEKFEGKLVKVRAIYRYGFEWSEIYSLKCETSKRIWVEATDKKCEDSSETEDLPFAGVGSKTAGIVALGKFTFKNGGYGHMNAFDYKFTISCFEKAKIIDNEGFVRQALTLEQKRRIEAFERED